MVQLLSSPQNAGGQLTQLDPRDIQWRAKLSQCLQNFDSLLTTPTTGNVLKQEETIL